MSYTPPNPNGQATKANSSPVVLASDQGALTIDGSAVTQPVSAASLPLPAGAATSASQTTGNSSLSSIDGKITAVNTGAVVVSSSALPTSAATSTKQSDGSQKTQVVDGSGNVIGATSNALDINVKSGTIATTHTDTAPATQNITAADAASTSTAQQNAQSAITGTPTANSAASFTISGLSTIDVQVTGTWVATLSVEISMDGGTTYFTRGFHLAGTTYTVGSLTSNATGTLSVAGMTNFRIRATAYTSGTATVKVSGSVNPGVFYIANSPQISDGTNPSQKLAINASGQVSESNFPTTVDTNSGTKSASTLRMVLATDQPQLTNALKVDGSAVTQPVSLATNTPTLQSGSTTAVTQATAANLNATVIGTGTFAVQGAQSGTWTVQPGNTANTTPWLTANAVSTPVLKSGLTNTASAVISSAAATLNDYYVYNPNATVAYVQIFDVATAGGVTVGTTTPKWSVGIPATSAANISGLSLTFANGIQVCATTTATGSTAPSTALDANFGYR